MTSLATRLAAARMGGNAVYGDLKPGDVFSFPTTRGEGVVYRKLANGYFTFADAGPRPDTFRTGKGTAVTKLPHDRRHT